MLLVINAINTYKDLNTTYENENVFNYLYLFFVAAKDKKITTIYSVCVCVCVYTKNYIHFLFFALDTFIGQINQKILLYYYDLSVFFFFTSGVSHLSFKEVNCQVLH